MKAVIIRKGTKYELESQGNGTLYILRSLSPLLELTCQDEDALTFYNELDSLEVAFPTRSVDDILHTLFVQYWINED